jgi:hypothetical protein
MPGFPFPGRAGRELDQSLLDALADGQSLPPDAPEELRAVADMLAGLADPEGPGELAGEAAARAAFARLVSPARVSRPPARRRSWLSAPRAGLAAALVAAAAGLGGVAAAAYAGVLPGPAQNWAHHMIGAPPARHAQDPRQSARLCSAYQNALIHGPARAKAIAYRSLEKAAGGAGKIGAYCAVAEWAGVAPPPTLPPTPPATPTPSLTPTPPATPNVGPAG